MKKDEFESATLELWMTTGIPLTQANLQYHTRLPRRKLRTWLEAMVGEGVLEMDCDDAGEIIYTVPGADRPPTGPRTFAELERLGALRGQVTTELVRQNEARRRLAAEASRRRGAAARPGGRTRGLLGELDDSSLATATTALSIAKGARSELEKGVGENKKSLLVSGGLSLVLGPLGWLYAGSFRESLPAAAAYLLIAAIVPGFLLLPLLTVALPISAVAGLVYAWQFNRDGQRGHIFGNDDDKESRRNK